MHNYCLFQVGVMHHVKFTFQYPLLQRELLQIFGFIWCVIMLLSGVYFYKGLMLYDYGIEILYEAVHPSGSLFKDLGP